MSGEIPLQLLKSLEGVAWDMSVDFYTIGGDVIIEQDCFAFMFTNIGDTIGTVKDMVVFPSATPATALGDTRVVGAHNLNIFKGQVQIKFLPPLGANPKIEIVQLFYVGGEGQRKR